MKIAAQFLSVFRRGIPSRHSVALHPADRISADAIRRHGADAADVVFGREVGAWLAPTCEVDGRHDVPASGEGGRHGV